MLKITKHLLVSTGSGTPQLFVTLPLRLTLSITRNFFDRMKLEFGANGAALDWQSSHSSGPHQYETLCWLLQSDYAWECPSRIGLLLFSAYVAPVSCSVDAHGLLHHSYEDDLKLYNRAYTNYQVSRTKVTSSTADVGLWFMYNDPQLNASKSKVIEISTASQW